MKYSIKLPPVGFAGYYPHQFIDRNTSEVVTEQLIADKIVNTIYASSRETPSALIKLVTSSRFSNLLGYLFYDMGLMKNPARLNRMIQKLDINLHECIDPPEKLNSARKLFERQIKYWECRPMPFEEHIIVSPADARMVAGSFEKTSSLFIKDKFFSYEELLGKDQHSWLKSFHRGDFAIFRLTPEKYHHNHLPVTGIVKDIYEIDGCCNSCNPGAVVRSVTPYSKNHRIVTIIDTDIPGGSEVGLVAMIEVVALMIGSIKQCYSDTKYDNPIPVKPGLFVHRGQPKSLFRPGSSVDVILFQQNRIRFDTDILENMTRRKVKSRFAHNFGQPLVETNVEVRSSIASKNIK